MSEENTSGSSDYGHQDGQNGQPQGGQDVGRTFTQAEVERVIADRLDRERSKYSDYGQLREKAAKLDELENAAKSEQQRLTEALEAERRRASELETRSLRAEVAAAKGVPANSIAGTDRESMEKAADELLAWRAEAAKSHTLNPRGAFFSGASTPEGGGADDKERAAAALRRMRA